jgi:Protein of unknown function (DUF2852)
MGVAARLDDMGQAAWIGLLVLSFILFWPAGLALLAFLIWSGRMGCGNSGKWARMKDKMERWHERSHRDGRTSGNSAFDEYRAETLRRLEEEQKEFFDFLERLRKAKDKTEFDEFMSEQRKRRPFGQDNGPQAQPQS